MKIKIPNTMAKPNINDKQKALILNEIYMHKFRGKDLPDRRKRVFSLIFNRHALRAFKDFFDDREINSFPEAVSYLDDIVDEVVNYFHSGHFEENKIKMYAVESEQVERDDIVKGIVTSVRRKMKRKIKKYTI